VTTGLLVPGRVTGRGIAGRRARLEGSEISAAPAEPFQTRLVFENVAQLSGAQPAVLLEIQHDRRIQITAPGCHHQSLERGKTHARIDRTTVPNRGEAGPGPEVAEDRAVTIGI